MEGPGLESVSKFYALGMRGAVKWKRMMSIINFKEIYVVFIIFER